MTEAIRTIMHLQHHHIEQLHQLYQSAWWSKGRTLEETQRCVAHSQVCIGLVDDHDRLIGFTRVLTDFVFKALLFDVIVCEQWQGRGLGNMLMNQLKAHPELQAVKHFELYCLPEMTAFYEKHGFSAELGDLQFMRFENKRSPV